MREHGFDTLCMSLDFSAYTHGLMDCRLIKTLRFYHLLGTLTSCPFAEHVAMSKQSMEQESNHVDWVEQR